MDPNLDLIEILNSNRARIEDRKKVVLTSTLPKEKPGPPGNNLLEEIRYDQRVRCLKGPYNPFSRFKPIFVLSDKGTSDRNLRIVEEALKEVLGSVGLGRIIPVHRFGYWNMGNGPHQSIDWYIQRAFDSERRQYDMNGQGQCDLEQFWMDLKEDPIQNVRPHYDVLVLSDFDLYSSNPSYPYRFMIGEGPEQGTILSIMRYKNEGDEIVRQGALHEFGHTFAQLNHCGQVKDGTQGECTMKFPNTIPDDLIVQAMYRRKKGKLFCNKHELSRYGLEGNEKHLEVFDEVKRLYQEILSLNPILLRAIDSGKLALLETRIELI